MNFIPLLWPQEKLAGLRAEIEGYSADPHAAPALQARCALAAGEGDFAEAQRLAALARVHYRDKPDMPHFEVALYCLFISQDFEGLAELLCAKQGLDISLQICVISIGLGRHVFELVFGEGRSLTVRFDLSVLQGEHAFVQIVQFDWVLPMFAAYAASPGHETGSVYFNNGDAGNVAGLAMCSNRPDNFLVPDNVFMPTRGYKGMREDVLRAAPEWGQRIPVAFWRGTTTGLMADRALGWRSLPRVALSEIARDHAEIIDAGITRVAQIADPDAADELQKMGLLRDFVPMSEFIKYKYQIDIDGNSNAWSALFQKLLTGSTVLKIASPHGFEQWYYNRLKPWVNYVPVLADMSDLVEKVQWLIGHDDIARRIGQRGQALAVSMTYESEVRYAVRSIGAAVRYGAARPEIDLAFGAAQPGQALLREGWHPAALEGAAPSGTYSHMVIEVPPGREDMVLNLELAPYPGLPGQADQRLSVAVNGEIAFSGAVLERQIVTCQLRHADLVRAGVIDVILLHPDSAAIASSIAPLDERRFSILLYRVCLTPVISHYRSLRAPWFEHVKPGQVLHLEGAPFVAEAAACKQLHTCHGTVVFADPVKGELRHGAKASSPHNVVVADVNDKMALCYCTPQGHLKNIVFFPGGFDPRSIGPTTLVGGVFMFDIIKSADNGVSLSGGGLLLAADSGGLVTLSRGVVGPWEVFRINEISHSD